MTPSAVPRGEMSEVLHSDSTTIGPMTRGERRAAFWLASIFALRMLGLFMILPVFALYAEHLQDSTPALAGLAIGIYGLSQAICQIPFGSLSDRYGRKRMISLGLLVFAIGSAVAAISDTIWGVLLGRALQGSGAISAAVMALAADLTREAHRLKVMAAIGITMGVSFAISMIAGPVLSHWIGVPGIFWLTGTLALLSIAVVRFYVPNPPVGVLHSMTPTAVQLQRVWADPALVRINLGIFILHLLLTSTFVAVPLALRDAGLPSDQHWQVYLPVLVCSMVMMMPFIRIANQPNGVRPVFLGAICTLAVTECGLIVLHDGLIAIGLLLFLFFSGFNLLEAMLPSLIAKIAPPDAKGTAMGFYASSQFLGAFVGGALGGVMRGWAGFTGVFTCGMIAAFVWFFAAYTAPKC